MVDPSFHPDSSEEFWKFLLRIGARYLRTKNRGPTGPAPKSDNTWKSQKQRRRKRIEQDKELGRLLRKVGIKEIALFWNLDTRTKNKLMPCLKRLIRVRERKIMNFASFADVKIPQKIIPISSYLKSTKRSNP